MAFDSYMQFLPAEGTALKGESQVVLNLTNDTLAKGSGQAQELQQGCLFEIDDFSFDIEQVLNIGSQSSGAGAGKVTFNPFKVTRKTDRASPVFFMMCCAGQHFKYVTLCLRRAGGGSGTAGGGSTAVQNSAATMQSGTTFLRFDFALVAVKTISWSGSDGDEAPKEEVEFEYGALMVQYIQQNTTGAGNAAPVSGSWNRVYNNNNFTDITTTFS
jgi:type VI secretion system secreted protein Hcp